VDGKGRGGVLAPQTGALKQMLMTAPLLQMPDFDRWFVIDSDTSGTGFGTVLDKGDDANAYFSRPVVQHHKKLSAYERMLIGLIKVV
jgi:hypothetical protein